MKTGYQLPTFTFLDFIQEYYGDVRYLPYYMNEMGMVYSDFVSGTTVLRELPELTLPTENETEIVTFPNETEYITVDKFHKQTLFDITLQNYGNIEKVFDNLKDASINEIWLYRDLLQYNKSDVLKNKLTENYKKNSTKIATGTRMIEILPEGLMLDIYGDFTDDYNNDFDI